MGVAEHIPGNRWNSCILPFPDGSVGIRAAISINEQNAILPEYSIGPGEVKSQHSPGLEELVTEIHGQDDIRRLAFRLKGVLL